LDTPRKSTRVLDTCFRSIAEEIVERMNIVTVGATSHHFMPLLARFTGLNNALIHWKNRATMTP
jgi:hypothetical protein